MLAGYYETPLVLVSIAVAVLASYTALTMAGRVAQAGATSWPWLLGGAFAMGTGIWAMHFVGMLAFRLPIPLGYDPGITLASWLLPVAVSLVAMWQLSRAQLPSSRLAISALLIGAGINLMHYVGMAGMRMRPGIVWDPWLVAVSVFIAAGAAAVALWLAFRLRDENRPHVERTRGAAAIVMGAAIVGMHYTGMAAAGFPEGSICFAARGGFSLTQLAILVIVATVSVLAIALLAAVYDARLEARQQVLEIAQRTSTERQALLESERAARAEAERLGAMKDEFLATLSHELRTPLNAVLGWVQLLRMKKDEAALRTGLDTIERNARLQAQLIEDLLDMSRIVSGKLRLQRELLDPVPVVQAVVASAQPNAFDKGLTLHAQLEAQGARIFGDAARLEQILWNLLSNALKFTPQGGRIDVRLLRSGNWLEISVSDTGSGIAPDFLPHVFERFRQGDGSTTRRYSGLGLGLSIVGQLTQLHGGTVRAHSEGLGHGATFTVCLPVADDNSRGKPANAPGIRAADSAAGPAELAGVTVLVVEDDDDARELVRGLLAACGADVLLAAGADEAMRIIEAQHPRVLVSDIAMPEVDGYELMRRVRGHADARVARMPAIALSAFAGPGDAARARDAGFDVHLPKPVEAPALQREVKRAAMNTLG